MEKTFNYKGISIAWGCVGSGPAIVLIHGFPWSAQAWRRIVPWLSSSFSVYYYDMAGCGQSGKHDGQNVAPSTQSELLAALLKHWGLTRPNVVGHDFGGLAALRGHLIEELEYSSLTLIDSVALLPSGSPFFAHAQIHNEAMAEQPGFIHEAVFRAFANYGSLHGLSDQVLDMYFQPWSGVVGQAAFYRKIAQSDKSSLEEIQGALGPLPFPTRLIWGRHDRNIAVEQGRRLADLLAVETFDVVENAAHMVMEDAPEAVLGALLRR